VDKNATHLPNRRRFRLESRSDVTHHFSFSHQKRNLFPKPKPVYFCGSSAACPLLTARPIKETFHCRSRQFCGSFFSGTKEEKERSQMAPTATFSESVKRWREMILTL
jgi:hypothetical protein